MGSETPLLTYLLMVVSGRVYRHQLLKDMLRGKRIRFSDAGRALLATKTKSIGREAHLKFDTVV